MLTIRVCILFYDVIIIIIIIIIINIIIVVVIYFIILVIIMVTVRYESYFTMRGCPFSGKGSGTVAKIAAGHNVSVARVCLRWVLERGGILAVGTGANASTVGEYAEENLNLYNFALTQAEVTQLNGIQSV